MNPTPGTPEWYDELNKRVTFPERFIFYYNKKHDVIEVRFLQSKAKVENARWCDVRPSPLALQISSDNAVIQVKEITDAAMYYEELTRLQQEWTRPKEERIFIVVYHNHVAGQLQTKQLKAKNAFRAGRLFYRNYKWKISHIHEVTNN